MKKIKKVLCGVGMCLAFGSVNLSANTYVVQSGDMLLSITHKLGFSSIKEAGFKVPSGDLNKIFPGDVLTYTKHKKKKKKFVERKRKIDLDKFCFKDSSSIHYRAEERCKK